MMTMTQNVGGRIETPWGLSDDSGTTIAEGIRRLSTPSHGGYSLDADRWREFAAKFPGVVPFAGKGWFEEDCDWSLVVICFPEHFDRETISAAVMTASRWGAKKWTAVAKYLNSEAAKFVKAVAAEVRVEHADHWSVGSMSTNGGAWRVSLTHEASGECVSASMEDYQSARWYERLADGSFVAVAE